MSELAFDREGEPIEEHDDLVCYRVRYFPNPGGRGTCAVHRDSSGAPSYIERDASFLDFHHLVGGMAGLYRLDQCDVAKQPIPGAPAAYVLIGDGLRPATDRGAHATSNDPLVQVLREAISALAETSKAQTRAQGEVLHGAADVLRAADIAGISRRNAPAAPELEASEEEDDDDEDDDDNEEPPPDLPPEDQRWVRELLGMVKELTPLAKAWVVSKMSKLARTAPASPPPAAAADSTPAGSTPPPAAGSGTTPPSSAAAAGSSAPPPPTTEPTGEPAATATPEPEVAPRNATLTPTFEQVNHLLAIHACLSPREQAIAMEVTNRMSDEVKAQWLADLSTMTVEQAVAVVRSLIPAAPKKPTSGEEAA